MQARQVPPDVFRATINTVFSIVNIGALAMFLAAGKVTQNSLTGVLVAVPSLLIALRIGYIVREHVTAEKFKNLVLFLLFLSAISVGLSALQF